MGNFIDVDTVILSDNKEYFVLAEIDIYTFFAEVENNQNIVVRKTEGDSYIGLDNEDEVKKALSLLDKKYKE